MVYIGVMLRECREARAWLYRRQDFTQASSTSSSRRPTAESLLSRHAQLVRFVQPQRTF